ncbi:MAG: L-threonylcarbamoyladenylate synthase [Patescibacteria group bacterium]|mgnify:CR=1 FL=1
MSLSKALSALQSGQVIAHATETCYGFACDIFNEEALERLYQLKQMPCSKPVSILVGDLKMAKKFGIFSKKALDLAKKHWPGPLTIVLERKKSLPKFLNPGHKTVGIRVPKHALSLELVRKFGSPLTTTSANISTKPSPYSVSAIKAQFKKEQLKPDFMIDSGRLPRNPPSTIVDLSGKKMRIIRQGEIIL